MTAPLVLLHGFLGDREDLAAVAAELDRPTIAFDLPGHGVDPTPVAADDFAVAVAQVHAQITALTPPPWHLLGYSMGGRIALALAAFHATSVRSVVAIGAHPGLEEPDERRARREADSALADRLAHGALVEFLDAWYRRPLFTSLRAHPDFPAILARRAAGDPRHLAAALRAFGTGNQPPLADRLTVPILQIAGADDSKFVDLGATLSARCPLAAHRTVPGAGHAVHLEAPAEVARLTEEFLAHQDA